MILNSNAQLKDTPPLSCGNVHIWSACLSESEKDIPYFISILSEDERQKAEKFKFSRDRNFSIVSRGILRCLLGKYLEKSPKNIEIIYGLWGKPCLIGQPLYFNLSHSRDCALYAITQNYEVGVDLEYIDSSLDLEAIALSILSPQELAFWESIKPEEKLNTFFKHWVCKEAFLKALGKGWLNDQQTTPLKESDRLKNDNKNSERTEKMTTPYCFETIPGYASALFIDGLSLKPIYYAWNSRA